jgi:hypothetical protein
VGPTPPIGRSTKETRKMNARASLCVLLVFSWNGIDVIKKLHFLITSMSFQENTKRTLGDVLAFLNKKNAWVPPLNWPISKRKEKKKM